MKVILIGLLVALLLIGVGVYILFRRYSDDMRY